MEKIKNLKIEIINQSKENIDIDEKLKIIENIKKEKIISQPAYTISMISVDIIKKHLKSTMIPYALIYKSHSGRDFLASVKKDNNIICFNEEEIFKDIYDSHFNNDDYKKERNNDFAFILNLLFLHENSSHNKEKVLNINTNSPLIYLDKNFKTSFIIIDNNLTEGEAGYFTERFIGDRSIILGLLNSLNKLGNLLDVKYFNQENFNELIECYEKYKSVFENNGNNILAVYQPFKDSNDIKIIKNSYKKNLKNTKRDKYGFNEYDKYLFRLAKTTHSDY